MTRHPMVEQVNRLVGNLLAGGAELYLPGIGSLYVEQRGARRLSTREVEPPGRVVEFTSRQRGISLVEAIARVLWKEALDAGGATAATSGQIEARAQDIYGRWLARTFDDGVLTIEGVGVLKNKLFTPDEAFNDRINPQGRRPMRIHLRRRLGWPLWVGVALVTFAVGLVASRWIIDCWGPSRYSGPGPFIVIGGRPADTLNEANVDQYVKRIPELEEAVAGQEAEPNAGEQPAADMPSDTVAGSVGRAEVEVPAGAERRTGAAESAAEDAAAQPEVRVEAERRRADGVSDEPARLTSGRRYVVLGVFSSPANAARAAQKALEQDGTFRCGIYRFGDKYMVSPFESEDPEACKLFIRAHAEAFPGMWTYTAR